MIHPEQSPRTPTGLFATLRAYLHGRGSGAPFAARTLSRRLPIVALLAGLVLAFTFGEVAPAIASHPTFLGSKCGAFNHSHTSLVFDASINPFFLETRWSIAFATTKGGPWTVVPAGSGTITQTEANSIPPPGNNIAVHAGPLTGLAPEATYYMLATATNSDGKVEGERACETEPLRPNPFPPDVSRVTATSADARAVVEPRGYATHWRFEIASAEGGPWSPVPGAEGSITQAEAETALADGTVPTVDAALTGLAPGTRYFVRSFAEDEPEFPAGSGTILHKEVTSPFESFETAGPPVPVTFAVHALHGEAMRALGSVNPRSIPSSDEQMISIGGGPTGGTFSLAFKGRASGAKATGALMTAAMQFSP